MSDPHSGYLSQFPMRFNGHLNATMENPCNFCITTLVCTLHTLSIIELTSGLNHCFHLSHSVFFLSQACRNGLVHHLEHLLVYGADMESKNASGNTPLHVCAVNNQEACARMLLFRGANRGALNYANQTPYQVN